LLLFFCLFVYLFVSLFVFCVCFFVFLFFLIFQRKWRNDDHGIVNVKYISHVCRLQKSVSKKLIFENKDSKTSTVQGGKNTWCWRNFQLRFSALYHQKTPFQRCWVWEAFPVVIIHSTQHLLALTRVCYFSSKLCATFDSVRPHLTKPRKCSVSQGF